MQPNSQKTYTASSCLGDLPGHAAALDLRTPGEEVARIFKSNPELPGIMVTDCGEWAGALSQNRFLRLIGRPFGVELFYSRPMGVLLESADDPMIILPSDCTISEGLERCLARDAGDIYEPFIVEEIQSGIAQIVDFRTLLMASNDIAALRNQQMERILSAVAEGLLTITPDHMVGSEYSLALEQMFESKSIGGFALPELLSRFLDRKLCLEARDYLDVLFNPRMIDRLIESINPLREVTARFPGPEGGSPIVKEFSIRFRRMKQGGRVSQVLMRVEDVTRERALARELEVQNARSEEQMQLLLQIMHVDPGELAQFLETFDFHLITAAEWVQSNREGLRAGERVERIFRAIHSLKGEAGMLRLTQFQMRLHQYEETLTSVRNKGVNGDLGIESLSPLVPGLTELLRLSEGAKEAILQFQKVGNAVSGEGGHGEGRSQMFSSIQNLTAELSDRLRKPALFHSTTPEDDIPTRYRSIIKEALIQLVRNSMVHGVEPAQERQILGKPPTANLQFGIRQHPQENLLEAIFQDDGAGLDLDRIRRRVLELGWTWHDEETLKEVIFEPGFSTAGEATLDAGRGVGLDLLKKRIEELGGRIRIHFERHAYCAFQILLPLR